MEKALKEGGEKEVEATTTVVDVDVNDADVNDVGEPPKEQEEKEIQKVCSW